MYKCFDNRTYFFTAFSFLTFLDFFPFPESSVGADDAAGTAGGACPVKGGATPGGYIGCWVMANPGTPGGGGAVPGGSIWPGMGGGMVGLTHELCPVAAL